MFDSNRILVISPHTDDGEIGAGGSITKFIENKQEVFYVAFSTCEASVPLGFPNNILKEECNNATTKLGILPKNVTLLNYEVRTFSSYRQNILDDLIKIGREIQPDLILIPSSNDIHQDHQIIHMEALRAFKRSSSVWGYEHPWNNLTFTTDVFVKLEERHIVKKIDALKLYKSQDFRLYFGDSYIRALASTRGAQVDFTFAESFELLRILVR